jgi:hypothetical protein
MDGGNAASALASRSANTIGNVGATPIRPAK